MKRSKISKNFRDARDLCAGVAPRMWGENALKPENNHLERSWGSHWQECNVTTVIRRGRSRDCDDLEPVKRTSTSRKLRGASEATIAPSQSQRGISTNNQGDPPVAGSTGLRARKPKWGGNSRSTRGSSLSTDLLAMGGKGVSGQDTT